MCLFEANRNPRVRSRLDLSPTLYHPRQGVEKSPFQIDAKRLEIDENVNRAHFTKR